MGAARVIAGLELRRRIRDRSVFLQGVLAPIVMAAIIGFAFGGGIAFTATVGIADADGSPMTSSIVDGMTGDDAGDSPITFVRVDAGDVQGAVERGEVDAVIAFPAGFGDAVMTGSGGAEAIGVVYDPQQQITGDVTISIAKRIGAQIDAGRLAVAAALAASPTPPSGDALASLVADAATVTVPIAVDQQQAGAAYSPVAYFAPAMAMLFLFFTIGAGARSLMRERREGTLQRVRAAPISDTSVLVGKTAGVVLLGFLSLVIVWVVTTVVFGADWGAPAAVLGVIVGVVVAIAGISLLVTGAARTDAQADGLTAMVAFVLALLGGNFVSPGNLPDALERISKLTPNGQALAAFARIGAADATLVDVLPTVALLVVTGVIVGGVGLLLLRRKVLA